MSEAQPSYEIDNGSVLFALLEVGEVQLNGFMALHAAGGQHSQKRTVPLALHSLCIWTLPEYFTLFGRQPIPSQSHSGLLDALQPPDTGGKIRGVIRFSFG